MFQAIGLGDLRLDLAPAPFKGRAGSLEIGRYTGVANASARCRKRRDSPLPLLSVNRHTTAHTDRADMNVLSKDQPVFCLAVSIAAADERSHRS